MRAFRLALRHGADGVELDVRSSADGVPVVHHDARWSAAQPGVGAEAGRAVAATPAAGRPTLVPTLAEALDACRGALVNVEVKFERHDRGAAVATGSAADAAARALSQAVAAVLRGREALHRVLVSSFDLALLDAFQACSPGTSVGWLTDTAPDGATLAALAGRGHVSVHPYAPVIDAALVAAAHRVGLAVYAWTVDDPAEAVRLVTLGVDAIITNEPAAVLAALRTT